MADVRGSYPELFAELTAAVGRLLHHLVGHQDHDGVVRASDQPDA